MIKDELAASRQKIAELEHALSMLGGFSIDTAKLTDKIKEVEKARDTALRQRAHMFEQWEETHQALAATQKELAYVRKQIRDIQQGLTNLQKGIAPIPGKAAPPPILPPFNVGHIPSVAGTYSLHHKDGDRANNSAENLEIVEKFVEQKHPSATQTRMIQEMAEKRESRIMADLKLFLDAQLFAIPQLIVKNDGT